VQKLYTHMYVNAKMLPAEPVPGIRGGQDKGEWWKR
jgi:hypothetical protein